MKCKALKIDGRKCQANPGSSGFCFLHDPDKTEQAKAAQLKAAFSVKAMRIKLPEKSEWRELTLDDLRRLISELILRLVEGKLPNADPIAKVSYLGRLLIDACNATSLKERLEKLEARISEK